MKPNVEARYHQNQCSRMYQEQKQPSTKTRSGGSSPPETGLSLGEEGDPATTPPPLPPQPLSR